ncbi:SMC-Scp complex subunit ScpB [Fictibacillus barbaricus]|uniref:Segregation and condensation protein B n=1 Tax=Fictibacillus barbaricus TaxID=182136 RepID=A0ABS2ZM81_9BACL|nr:SMC-Scp complex subunit ScpB [Fictibacillus barbaricus]MBN3547790.1 SMC-Scp complex subunit ScpB [Fictibacillus barbaricus]GGB51572.1 segregation and condensation protein B [Fictibacillus barbaricus]
MERNEIKAVIEGLLFVSGDEGIDRKQIAQVLEIDVKELDPFIDELKKSYEASDRGMSIVEYAGSLQFVTKPEHAVFYERLVETPGHSTLSQAALETLAIIAYKQPITRSEIEEVRGVKTEKPLQTLSAKGLVKEVGRAEGTGRAILYGTTKAFLEHFGLQSLKELPPLPENIQEESVEQEADLFFSKFQESLTVEDQ